MAFPKNSKNYQTCFPSFLARLRADCRPEFRNEVCLLHNILLIFINGRRNPGLDGALQVLSYLVECLQSYPGCFGVWRQMYSEQGAHKEQSAVLLRHMMARWSSVRRQIDISALRETLLTFRDVNERDPRRNEDATRAVNVRSSCLLSLNGINCNRNRPQLSLRSISCLFPAEYR